MTAEYTQSQAQQMYEELTTLRASLDQAQAQIAVKDELIRDALAAVIGLHTDHYTAYGDEDEDDREYLGRLQGIADLFKAALSTDGVGLIEALREIAAIGNHCEIDEAIDIAKRALEGVGCS